MQYAPTLGGILRLRRKLTELGFALPVFETDIYAKSQFVITTPIIEGCRHIANSGNIVDLETLAKIEGEYKQIFDCRLTDGQHKLEFAHPDHVPMVSGFMGYTVENWVHIEGNFSKEEARELSKNLPQEKIFQIARWGKTDPTRLDRFLLKVLPWFYKFPAYA